MKKIAILNCQKAIEVCTGAACMKAFNEKLGTFSRYHDDDVALMAFWYCNGCNVSMEDPGFQEKLDRIRGMHLDAVHCGVCTRTNDQECPVITQTLDILEHDGVEVIRGTHPRGFRKAIAQEQDENKNPQ